MQVKPRKMKERCGGRARPLVLGLTFTVAATAAALAGCKGDGLVDGSYQGKDLASIHGEVSAVTLPAIDSVSLGIVWVSAKGQYVDSGPGGQGGDGGYGGLGGEGGVPGQAGGAAGEAGFGGNAGLGGLGGDAGPGGFGGEGALVPIGGGGAGGEAGAGGPDTGTGGVGPGAFTMTTVRARHAPGPTGSLLDPALVSCGGDPATVRVDDQYMAGATPIARTVSYKPSFPLSFTIGLNSLPPDDALVPLDVAVNGVGTFASARVVAFSDDNGNGKLDLPSADGVPDRILGVSTQQIVFLNGTYPPPAIANQGRIGPSGAALPNQVGYRLPQGFSFLDAAGNILPPTAPIDLRLAETKAEKENATLQVCASFEEWIEHTEPTRAAPSGANVFPSELRRDGLTWTYYPDSGNPCYQLAFLGHLCE